MPILLKIWPFQLNVVEMTDTTSMRLKKADGQCPIPGQQFLHRSIYKGPLRTERPDNVNADSAAKSAVLPMHDHHKLYLAFCDKQTREMKLLLHL